MSAVAFFAAGCCLAKFSAAFLVACAAFFSVLFSWSLCLSGITIRWREESAVGADDVWNRRERINHILNQHKHTYKQHVQKHIYTHTSIHTHIHTYTQKYMQKHIYTHIYIHSNMHTHNHTHRKIHTHNT